MIMPSDDYAFLMGDYFRLMSDFCSVWWLFL